ncbi:MAG: hypothetical protein ACJAT2_001933 [Bacteriovoracaceae bacterium]|jgi:hypothetical protein
MGLCFNAVIELLRNNISKFIAFLIFQTLIQLMSVAAEMLGILPGTAPDIWVQILTGILTIWNFCYLVQVYRVIKEDKEIEFFDQVLDATYDSFTFFLYSLLYGMTIIIGGFLFVIPGIYCFIFHYFAPFAAILKPEVNEGEESYLSFSRKIVKPHWGSVLGFFVVMFILNLFVPGITNLPFLSEVRIMLATILSPIDAILIMFSDLLGIHLFYYLCEKDQLSKDNSL